MAEALFARSLGSGVKEKLKIEVMRYHDPSKKNGTIVIQTVCAVLFCLFSFSWLYWFQADVLAVAQHVLSGGVTHYNRLVGAILITLILLLLQQAVVAITRLRRHTLSLTYVPSMFLLAVVSDLSQLSYFWLWCGLIVLLVWCGLVWLDRQMMPFNPEKVPTGLFSRKLWRNVLHLSCMMLGVAALGNTNAVYHYRAHAEISLLQGDIDEALRVGERSLETDASLTMIRAYALALKGELGSHLFEYPVAGSGADLIPLRDSRSRTLIVSPDSIYTLCGARPVAIYNTHRYLDILEKDSLARPAALHYRLCGLLIDRKLDAFAHTLVRFLPINDSLPRHYREALTLYTHQSSLPVVVYHDAVMDQDWEDLQKLRKEYASPNERKGKVAERYRGSYWYYYLYP